MDRESMRVCTDICRVAALRSLFLFVFGLVKAVGWAGGSIETLENLGDLVVFVLLFLLDLLSFLTVLSLSLFCIARIYP